MMKMINASRVPVLAGGVKARDDLCRREMDVEKRPQRLEAQGVDGAAGRQQAGSMGGSRPVSVEPSAGPRGWPHRPAWWHRGVSRGVFDLIETVK